MAELFSATLECPSKTIFSHSLWQMSFQHHPDQFPYSKRGGPLAYTCTLAQQETGTGLSFFSHRQDNIDFLIPAPTPFYIPQERQIWVLPPCVVCTPHQSTSKAPARQMVPNSRCLSTVIMYNFSCWLVTYRKTSGSAGSLYECQDQ